MQGIGELFAYKLKDNSDSVIVLTLQLLEAVVSNCGYEVLLVLNNAVFIYQMAQLAR